MLQFLPGRGVKRVKTPVRNSYEYLPVRLDRPDCRRGVHSRRLLAHPFPLERTCLRIKRIEPVAP